MFDVEGCNVINKQELNNDHLRYETEMSIQMTTNERLSHNEATNYLSKHTKWAVIQSCVDEGIIHQENHTRTLSKFHLCSRLASRFFLETDKYRVIPVSYIVRQSMGIINDISFPNSKTSQYDNTATVIHNPKTWESHFLG